MAVVLFGCLVAQVHPNHNRPHVEGSHGPHARPGFRDVRDLTGIWVGTPRQQVRPNNGALLGVCPGAPENGSAAPRAGAPPTNERTAGHAGGVGAWAPAGRALGSVAPCKANWPETRHGAATSRGKSGKAGRTPPAEVFKSRRDSNSAQNPRKKTRWCLQAN